MHTSVSPRVPGSCNFWPVSKLPNSGRPLSLAAAPGSGLACMCVCVCQYVHICVCYASGDCEIKSHHKALLCGCTDFKTKLPVCANG
jgi:hypothetical protein